jgi:hypothetical protein
LEFFRNSAERFSLLILKVAQQKKSHKLPINTEIDKKKLEKTKILGHSWIAFVFNCLVTTFFLNNLNQVVKEKKSKNN